jgi:hypothetical protein
MKWTK